MSKILILLASASSTLIASAGHAATVSDPVGDFLPSYEFDKFLDLDVTSFTVNYSPVTTTFTLSATLAGVINPATAGLYVIGVNNGTATNAPFALIGQPNVIFNQAIQVQKAGTATVGATALATTISGNSFTVLVPLAALTPSSFDPLTWGFNLWPRIGVGGGNAQISDFAPNNALLAASAPEPAAWAMIMLGFGLVGGAMRMRRGVARSA